MGELLRTGRRALRNAWKEGAAAQGEDGKGTGRDMWQLVLDPAPRREESPGKPWMGCDSHQGGTASVPPLRVPLHIQGNGLGQRVSHWCVPGDHGHSSCAVKTGNFRSLTHPCPSLGGQIWGKSQNFPKGNPRKACFPGGETESQRKAPWTGLPGATLSQGRALFLRYPGLTLSCPAFLFSVQ